MLTHYTRIRLEQEKKNRENQVEAPMEVSREEFSEEFTPQIEEYNPQIEQLNPQIEEVEEVEKTSKRKKK